MNTEYHHFYSMGTRLDAVFTGIDKKRAGMLSRLIRNELEALENILSIYRPGSELSRLNKTAVTNDVSVSPRLYDCLLSCMASYKLSSGVFDAAFVGSKGSAGMDFVEINETKKSVRYHDRNIKIDPGGFGKGQAMRDVQKTLLAEGISDALISFGGSSVLALGKHPHGSYWPIAVSGIFNPGSAVKVARLNDMSMSTSGTGFAGSKGAFKPSGNIIDPRTGHAVVEPRTASVISGDPLEAEILSTALVVDSDCLSGEFDATGKKAFTVVYDEAKEFVINEIF